jgi:hypothetical protein
VRKLFFQVSCALILAALSSAAAIGQSLLPPTFADWSIAQSAAAQPATLDQAAGENAAILREYGFEAIEQQQYAHGSDTLSATLYRMMDPTAAYGAFTYLRTPEMRASNVAKFAAATPDHALVVIGNLLLDIHGTRLAERGDALKSLVASVSPKADRRPYPLIADHLPDADLVPGSEKYFIGPVAASKITGLPATDWVGFNFGAEAILAKYKKGSQEATLLLIEYPTQQLAAKQLPQVQSIADSASSPTPTAAHPAITAKRIAGLISLAFATQQNKFADSVLSNVKFGHDVTWNEPSFKAKEPSINIMVVGAFVGTGVILMLAVISGLGFAILRLLAKIFFPGKIFDRPERLEILQLGLTGTRPNTKDLY